MAHLRRAPSRPGACPCEHHGHTGGEVENVADDGIQREVEGDDHRFLPQLHHRGQVDQVLASHPATAKPE
jgi:hypothetical protein